MFVSLPLYLQKIGFLSVKSVIFGASLAYTAFCGKAASGKIRLSLIGFL
jgi:hypothetical protein